MRILVVSVPSDGSFTKWLENFPIVGFAAGVEPCRRGRELPSNLDRAPIAVVRRGGDSIFGCATDRKDDVPSKVVRYTFITSEVMSVNTQSDLEIFITFNSFKTPWNYAKGDGDVIAVRMQHGPVPDEWFVGGSVLAPIEAAHPSETDSAQEAIGPEHAEFGARLAHSHVASNKAMSIAADALVKPALREALCHLLLANSGSENDRLMHFCVAKGYLIAQMCIPGFLLVGSPVGDLQPYPGTLIPDELSFISPTQACASLKGFEPDFRAAPPPTRRSEGHVTLTDASGSFKDGGAHTFLGDVLLKALRTVHLQHEVFSIVSAAQLSPEPERVIWSRLLSVASYASRDPNMGVHQPGAQELSGIFAVETQFTRDETVFRQLARSHLCGGGEGAQADLDLLRLFQQ